MVKKSVELLACAEAAQSQEAPQTTISDRSIQILAEMRRPLHRQDIHLLAEIDGLGEIQLGSLTNTLGKMIRKGTIVRIEKGVYSLPEFAGEEYELPEKITNQAKLSALLERAGKPLHLTVIEQLAESDDSGSVDAGNIGLALPKMVRKGLIIRIAKGVYSAPEFANEEYELPKSGMRVRLKAVLAQAERSLPPREIISETKKDGLGALNSASAYSMLSQMVRQGDLVLTSRGFYCLPEFADKEYEPPAASLGERATAALWQAGRLLHWQEIHWQAETDGLGEIRPDSLQSSLNKMVYRGSIVRIEPGIFSLPEFAYAGEKDPDSYATKAEVTRKILRIITEVGGSASLGYIYLSLADSNLKVLSLKNISNLLNRMIQGEEPKRKIVKTAENIYCLSESAEGEYEILESGIQNRLLAIFQSAPRPLHRQKLYQLTEEDGQEALKANSINTFLSSMVSEGTIVRVTAGVYSLPEFVDQAYEVPRLSIEMRAIEALEEARQPLHRSEIARLINSDDQAKVSLISVHHALITMADSNIIIRVEPGVYSLPEFANENYELPRITLEGRLMSVLQEARRPLDLQEICYQAAKDGQGAIKWLQSAHAILTWMADEGIVLKTARGIYSMPEFAKERYEPFKLTIGIMVRESLTEARQPLPVPDIHRLINSRSEDEVSLESLRVELGRLTSKGTIVRVARGIYSLPEFADSADN